MELCSPLFQKLTGTTADVTTTTTKQISYNPTVFLPLNQPLYVVCMGSVRVKSIKLVVVVVVVVLLLH